MHIGGTLKAADVVEPSTGTSVLTVLSHALPLDSPLPPTVLVHDLEVSDLAVTLVNGVPTDTWILDAPGAEVRLTQNAEFSSGLEVTGASTLMGRVNGVLLDDLDKTTLKTVGDQDVFGHKTFQSIDTYA